MSVYPTETRMVYRFIDEYPDAATVLIIALTSIVELLFLSWEIILKAIAAMVATFIVTLPLNLLLKNTFKIKRPTSYAGSRTFEYSFPSFHAQFSASEAFTYVTVVFLSRKVAAIIVALLFMVPSSALIAYSRIELNVHSAKDSLAGYVIGALTGILVATVYYSFCTSKYIDVLSASAFVVLLHLVSKKERMAKLHKRGG